MRLIAELSANHNGSLERAKASVKAAAQIQVDTGVPISIKLQTWTPGRMVLNPNLVLRDGPWVGMNLAQLYEKALMPWEEQHQVFAYALEQGIECFSSVFDLEALDFLEMQHCPRYKIASFEITDLRLIHETASTKKPLIISTGMATIEEITAAVEAARAGGCRDLTLLKCTSAYPADGSAANLRTMDYLAKKFDCAAGLSDHTRGIGVALVALAWDAAVVEKHFTLDRAAGGLDAAFSIEPAELEMLAREAKTVRRSLGVVQLGPTDHELPQVALRRSLYFARTLPEGHVLAEGDIASARPANGISPRFYRRLLGSRLLRAVNEGQPVQWESVEKPSLTQSINAA